MFIRSICIIFLLFSIHSIHAQNYDTIEFGKPLPSEIGDFIYTKDSTVAAVIMYEKGVTTVKDINNYLRLVTTVHKKIKVIDPKKFGDAVVDIEFYITNNHNQKVTNLKAITHNGMQQTFVNSNAIFTKDIDGRWKSVSFTFPGIKAQSLLEYTYDLESTSYQNLEWIFQEEFPKLYSEYISEIPGNFDYRIALRGSQKLFSRDNFIKKSCFSLPGAGKPADCYYNKFVMKDIPAFYEEEYMLSKHNYISRIEYELKETYSLDGHKTEYTTNWDDVDETIRYDSNTGKQLKHQSFFEGNLPPELLTTVDPLEKAKGIYYFIQKHFTWNGSYRVFQDIDVKEAYENGAGTLSEINLGLLNALQAANIEAYLTLSSTRSFAIPNQLYPVLTDFNYVMAYLKVGNESYFLDATDKYNSFGLLPFRAMNHVARIMNFKQGSYWQPIDPYAKNQMYFSTKAKISSEGNLIGDVQEISSGFFGSNVRKDRNSQDLESYLKEKAGSLEITNYKSENLLELELPMKESYTFQKDLEIIDGEYFIYPYFLMDYFDENPFKAQSRDFPIDLGYPFNFNYLMSIELDEGWTTSFLPEARSFKLPNDLGVCSIAYSEINGAVTLRLNVQLSQAHMSSDYYEVLKTFYAKVVEAKTKEPIILKKN